jgi:hypothetical protein
MGVLALSLEVAFIILQRSGREAEALCQAVNIVGLHILYLIHPFKIKVGHSYFLA